MSMIAVYDSSTSESGAFADRVVDVSVSQVLSRTHEGVYLESLQEIDAFLEALKLSAVEANKRIRLR
ncbi:hypothetical protein HOP52_05895 [Halomonas campisalis]|uniref:Uncharacterized protein n=1 Tax=Billgrantia campisalis TaxID=74661 RepID=A0ABS9P6A3_9GAMM|nr:hypothetical protein [Halomonas campisalis]MCG6657304.1 hypothetical protein [Halomonas campisalis]MDR5864154.1 hypothetical protein [Halomonas campisalis]